MTTSTRDAWQAEHMTLTTTVRNHALRQVRRNTILGVDLYSRGLVLRRGMTRAEVLAMRRAAEWYLGKDAFRPEASTLVEKVRASYDGGQVRGEWVSKPGARPHAEGVVLYIHGGAFVAFSPRTHRGLVSEIAGRSGRVAFSVDYRLAPEHRFPAAADDVLRAYRWLLDSGIPADKIVVAGDSAGGHLSLGLTPRAVRAGLPAPAGVVGISPLVDPSMELGRAWELETEGTSKGAATARAVIGMYPHRADLNDPELLLTEDDLSVLPPVLLQASADEFLTRDAEAYLEALLAAGGEGELQTWPRKPHVFQIAWRISRTASKAVDDIATFVAKQVP